MRASRARRRIGTRRNHRRVDRRRCALGLTAREREILALVAQGHRNAQVATALWISPGTVGKHLENAYAKLGVTTRTAAVRLVHEHDAGDIGEQPPGTRSLVE